jgi:hypothetical protein
VTFPCLCIITQIVSALYFSPFYLSPFLMVISTDLKILYLFLYSLHQSYYCHFQVLYTIFNCNVLFTLAAQVCAFTHTNIWVMPCAMTLPQQEYHQVTENFQLHYNLLWLLLYQLLVLLFKMSLPSTCFFYDFINSKVRMNLHSIFL